MKSSLGSASTFLKTRNRKGFFLSLLLFFISGSGLCRNDRFKYFKKFGYLTVFRKERTKDIQIYNTLCVFLRNKQRERERENIKEKWGGKDPGV